MHLSLWFTFNFELNGYDKIFEIPPTILLLFKWFFIYKSQQDPTEEGVAEEPGEEKEQTAEEEEGMAGISLNSLLGVTSSNTMKLVGALGSREVVVLIDSGAAHNFLSKKIVRECNTLKN